jgi:small subunit ribosomal protein S9
MAKKTEKTVKQEEKEAKQKNRLTISGKRKTAVAKATIQPGTGIIKINKKPLDTFSFFRRLALIEPLRIAEETLKEKSNTYDINIVVTGGGVESQIEASRLAIARAIIAFTKSPELKSAYTNYDWSLLVADVRRKETRKPGDSKARAKRQKSYR